MDTQGNWGLTNNNSSNSTRLLGIALGTNVSTQGVFIRGNIRLSAFTFQEGDPLYISNANGKFSSSPSVVGSGDYARIIGYGLPTNTIYFNPDNTWVQVV